MYWHSSYVGSWALRIWLVLPTLLTQLAKLPPDISAPFWLTLDLERVHVSYPVTHHLSHRVSAQAQRAKEQLSRSGLVMYSLVEKFIALTVMLFSKSSNCFASRGPLCWELQRTLVILLKSQKMAGKWNKRKRQMHCYISPFPKEKEESD